MFRLRYAILKLFISSFKIIHTLCQENIIVQTIFLLQNMCLTLCILQLVYLFFHKICLRKNTFVKIQDNIISTI